MLGSRNTKSKLKRWFGGERGSTMIMVTVSIVAMFAFAVLAIDAAILMATRTQLHNAADAAALAGATGLIEGDQNLATARAIDFASYNEAYQVTSQPVVIDASDVSFPEVDVIRVQTHRTAAKGDALRTFFMRVINPSSNNTADMTAVAAARIYDVCSSRCLKPWAIPDRHQDLDGNGIWDPGELYDPVATGYQAPTDVGASVVLKVGNPQTAIEPGIFYPVDFPPINNPDGENPLTGGSWYRQWIAGCAQYVIGIGDELQLEPGNMVGPTRHGMEDLIAQDPGAYWNDGTKTVEGSAFGLSPRVGLVPFFDPTLPPTSGRNSVTVTKIGAFFIESVGPGSQVQGRFMQLTTQGRPCSGGGGGTGLVKGIILVE
jgi:Flp pilus assembly protein TadG